VLRTVTFSDPEVAAYINKNFVSAWFNRGPGFFNQDLSTERWIFTSSLDAYPTKNICTFFLAPDGRVFSYVAGLWSPELFMGFLRDAVELRSRLFDAKMQPKDGGIEAARKLREDRLRDMQESLENAKEAEGSATGWQGLVKGAKPYTYRGQTHTHGAGCVRALREGFDYLVKLHAHWAKAAELPDLESVRYSYLYGNEFTEESPQAERIASLPKDDVPPPPPAPKTPRLAKVKRSEVDLKGGGRLGVASGVPSLSVLGGQ
jgi:hypothetical protein